MSSKFRRLLTFFLALILFSFLLLNPWARPLQAATFTVNSTGDLGDATPGDGICSTEGLDCTLRAAIEEANALFGADAISFSAANDNVRQTVQFSAATDGAAAGAVTGNDAITNFDANAGDATDDLIQIATGTLKTALDDDSDAALDYAAANGADGGNQAIVGAANQEATVLVDAEVEINVGDLTTAGLANLIGELGEEIDFTALATGQEHLFIVNVSATQAGIILYTASTGGDDVVDAADIQLLGIVTHNDGTNLVATDLTF